jgi:hypothetical protein
MTPKADRPTAPSRHGFAFPDGIAALALVAMVYLLYGTTLRLWWTFDDLFHAHFLLTHRPVAYCFSPEVWGRLPFQMFTPLQFLSYHADLALFGLVPAALYAHQLLALALAAVALYLAFRLWLSRPLAWAAALLFLLGIPCASWAIQLMLRHYVEGLALAALAVWVFVEALRRGRPSLLALSATLYFLAMLEKEVYVPLLALLALLPEGAWRARRRSLGLHALALVLYLGWRWAMLGTLFGGYGLANRPSELPGLVGGLPTRLAGAVIGDVGPASLVLLGCLLAGLAFLAWKRPGSLWLVGASLVLIVGPIVPVAQNVNERFGALPWLLAVAGFVFGCRELAVRSAGGRRAAIVLVAVAAAAALVSNRLDWSRRYAAADRMSAEGRFFLSMAPGDLLRSPRIPPAAMTEVRWLKEERLRLPRGSGWFADDVFLCGAGAAKGRIWAYDDSRRGFADVTARAAQAASRFCSGLRREAPLSARFESSAGAVFWTLGPYEEGRYALVFDAGVASLPVARTAGYRTRSRRLTLMVRYESPAGWVTYSPPLSMDFREAKRFRWERGMGDTPPGRATPGVSSAPGATGSGPKTSEARVLSPRPTHPMLVKVVASCPPDCGVLVQGEVETSTREFVHRFFFPARAVGAVAPSRTEVEEMRLVTFPPDSKDWVVNCPVCGRPIRVEPSAAAGA